MTDEASPLDLGFEETHGPDDPPKQDGDYRWYNAARVLGLQVWIGGDWHFAGLIEPAARTARCHDGKRGYLVWTYDEERDPQRAATIDAAKARLLEVSGANGKDLS